MPTRITSAQPADLIAYAWYGLGFRPRESLVAIGLNGPRLAADALVRTDLPGNADERWAAVRDVVEVLTVSGAHSVLLLVVSDSPPAEGSGKLPQWLIAIEELQVALRPVGTDVLEVLLVARDGFRPLGPLRACGPDCPPDCCPAHSSRCPANWVPLSEVEHSRVAASLVLEGQTVAADESELVADVDPAGADRRGEAPLEVRSTPGADRRSALFDSWCTDLDVNADQVTDPEGLLAMITGHLGSRDAVLVSPVPTARTAARRLVRGRGGGPAFGTAFTRPPAAQVLRTSTRLLAAVASRAPVGRRADPLAVLAFWAWADGDAARSRLLVERARRDRPDHRLAALVQQSLLIPTRPPWAVPEEPPDE